MRRLDWQQKGAELHDKTEEEMRSRNDRLRRLWVLTNEDIYQNIK